MVWFVRKPNKRAAIVARGRRHRAGGLKISGRPSEVPLPGGRRHWAGGSCCSTGPANLAGSPGAANQTLPSVQIAAGRFHRGGGLSFSLLLPLPVETPAKAADSRDSAQRGGALCVLRRQPCQHSGNTPGGLPSRRASFFQGVSPCAKMIARSGKKSGKNFPHVVTPSDGPASWPSSACSAWSAISTTPPSCICARPSSSASRGGGHVLQ